MQLFLTNEKRYSGIQTLLVSRNVYIKRIPSAEKLHFNQMNRFYSIRGWEGWGFIVLGVKPFGGDSEAR